MKKNKMSHLQEDNDYIINESECKEKVIQVGMQTNTTSSEFEIETSDVATENSELEMDKESRTSTIVVRRSQRKPKKKVNNEHDFTAAKPAARKRDKKQSLGKRLPQKEKFLSNRQQKTAETSASNRISSTSEASATPGSNKMSRTSTERKKTSPKSTQQLTEKPIEATKRSSRRSKDNVFETSSSSSLSAKGKHGAEKRPVHSTRYDGIKHLPEINAQKKLTTRCKREGCSSKSTVFCSKCKIHLCLRRGRNCFRDFHTISTYHK